ncbi:MAG: ribonuclease Z [Burkholderiales bacterium]|nr:ribonuclease Z [Burkholderiales bacterium]
MRPLFEPALVNDAFGDPGLYADFRDERRALLFDLGDVSALVPRKLLRISDIFVSHAHIDHFVGFDHWLRVVLGRKPRVSMYGGPGFVEQVGRKLAAYTWNVVHRYEVALTIEAHELAPDGSGRRARFSSLRRFAREDGGSWARLGDVLLAEDRFRVRAAFLDHDIPCLAFALEEAVHVNVWKNRLAELGLPTGPWLRAVKRAVIAGAPDDTPVAVQWRDRSGAQEATRTLGELRPTLELVPGRRVGYVTDIRYTDENLRTLDRLLAGVDILFIESVFLEAETDHAQRKNHLTAAQAGSIARRLGARAVVPFHFSPRYQGRAAELQAEVQGAWRGAAC